MVMCAMKKSRAGYPNKRRYCVVREGQPKEVAKDVNKKRGRHVAF